MNATVNNTIMEENTMERKANEVANEINNMGIKAEVTRVEKNGIDKFGITMGNGNVRPTLYIKDNDTRDSYEIAKEIVQQYRNLDPSVGEHYADSVNDILDWEKVKDKIIPCVMKINVDNLVTRKFLDMYEYFRIIVGENASIKVTKELFEEWDITKAKLHSTAIANTRGVYGAQSMFKMLMGINPELVTDFESMKDDPMFVITNESKNFGAGAFLHNKLFKAIANDLGNDLYIIPSSIHELFVVPMDNGMSESEVTSMIQEVNATQVAPEEVLSDHVYFFRREVGKVESR